MFKGVRYRPVEPTKTKLDAVIDSLKTSVRNKETNQKYGTDLHVPKIAPTLKKLFDKITASAHDHRSKVLKKRVFRSFLNLLPTDKKITDLTTDDYQLYINHRKTKTGKQTGQPIKQQTIFKELYQISSAIRQRLEHFPGNDTLKDWTGPEVPRAPRGLKRKSQRQRVVSEKELESVLMELRRDPRGRQTRMHHFARVRLAHILEFQYETGLRRKEVCALRFSQFDQRQDALLNLVRFKTSETVPIYPLSRRAVEIITNRQELQKTPYIFTQDGKPIESIYRTLKEVCEKLNISYGRYSENGWVAHDLRRNFGTEVLRSSDVETTRILLGHSNISQTQTYLSSDLETMRAAISTRDNVNYNEELEIIFAKVKHSKISLREFIENVKRLFGEKEANSLLGLAIFWQRKNKLAV